MREFTVVLQRDPYLCQVLNIDAATDSYTASRIEAGGLREAVTLARKEALKADLRSGREAGLFGRGEYRPTEASYRMLVMFEGHHDPILFGLY